MNKLDIIKNEYMSGKSNKALDLATQITEAEKNEYFYNLIGVIYSDLKQFSSAELNFHKAIEINSTYAPSYINIGNCYKSQGKLKLAERYYKTACELDYKFTASFINYAITAHSLGNASKAISYLRKNLKYHSDNSIYLALLGALQLEIKSYTEAESSLKAALQIDAKNADTWSNLAKCQYDQCEYKSALFSAQKALDICPTHKEALIHAGNAARSVKQFQFAIDFYEKAAKSNPENEIVYYNLAQTNLAVDEIDAAITHFKCALEINPTYPLALVNLIEILEKTNQLSECQKYLSNFSLKEKKYYADIEFYKSKLMYREGKFSEALTSLLHIKANEISDIRKASYFELLAKCYEKNQQFDNAFYTFEKMNGQVKDSNAFHSYNPEITLVDTKATMENLTSKKYPRLLLPNFPKIPFQISFIVGFPRSGTTLLDTILRSHPCVEVIEEKPIIYNIKEILKASYDYSDGQYLTTLQIKMARIEYLKALEQLLDLSKQETRVIIDKLPLNILEIHLISQIFPEANIILAIRHPLDSILSCWKQNFRLNKSMAIMTDLNWTAQYYDLAMSHYQTCLQKFDFKNTVLKYEDVVENSQQALRPVLDDFNLDWTYEMDEFYETAKRRAHINTPSYSQVVNPMYKNAVGLWDNYRSKLGSIIPQILPWCEEYHYHV